MNHIILQDIELFISVCPFRKILHGKRVLITGASGLIGSTLIRCLLALNEDIHIIAPVRNLAKLSNVLGDVAQCLHSFDCDLETFDFESIEEVDYIFHCAAPTASSFFISHPVETAHTIYGITDQLLRYAEKHKIEGMVFLSSLEVYGSGLDNNIITEDLQGYWDIQSVRSSYPIAKRAAENLCHLYAKEYGVPVKIARLTQTTGAGVEVNDNRVINQFARLAALGQDIVLHSTGESARPYCYTIDCILALIYIILEGTNGEAYNIANTETYISARELAEYIKTHFAPQIQVIFDINDNMGYAPVSRLNLSTAKLETLGWKPQYDLYKMLAQLISYYHEI